MTLQRIDGRALLDIVLVAAVFFLLLQLLRGTRAVMLLRGMIILILLVSLLASTLKLEAFSWLISKTFPALLLALPVIFQPELRRALERLGRAGSLLKRSAWEEDGNEVIRPIVQTA
jgi:diadenylate cyclase